MSMLSLWLVLLACPQSPPAGNVLLVDAPATSEAPATPETPSAPDAAVRFSFAINGLEHGNGAL